jgi:hypothetical protein
MIGDKYSSEIYLFDWMGSSFDCLLPLFGVLLYNHRDMPRDMDDQRFTLSNWGYLIFAIILSGGFYFLMVVRLGGFGRSLFYIIVDAFLFALGLLFWLAVFSQFVLPVRTLSERQKIFDRLLLYIAGGHGPAIFIRDGQLVKSLGEEKKKGPGVLWLDSASAAVTRTGTSFKQILGPGVHFIESGETLAGSVDLHKQLQKLGPWEGDEDFIFAVSPGEDTDDQKKGRYIQAQKRRLEVSAWTRDGVEVVPNISVIFQIDADPVKGDGPGSRFADLEPFAIRPPEDNPVFKAIVGEGINPKAASDVLRHVAWNQLPARIAVDLWREYLAKFTLQQLFEAKQSPPPEPPAPSGQLPAETQALFQSAHLASGGILAGMLYRINSRLARWADRCETGKSEPIKPKQEFQLRPDDSSPSGEHEKMTALQVINHMVMARMTQDRVTPMDDHGKSDLSREPNSSKEYDILKGRGVRVHTVGISGIRLHPSVEAQLIRQWKATWMQKAKAEKSQIDRLRSFTELKAQVEGDMEYAVSIGKSLKEEKPREQKEIIRTLLLRSRNELVKNDRFHRQADMERETLEEIIQWVERNGV